MRRLAGRRIVLFVKMLSSRTKGAVKWCLGKGRALFKANAVLFIALVAALLTCCLVRPGREYFAYFDWKTLSCLYCVLAVVGALRNIDFFTMLARRIVRYFRTMRLCILALAYITFIGSMFIANDMALLTFLPLGYYVLASTNHKRLLAFTFIIQNISANLGGMLTPFGNPQNLFLYTRFNIPTLEFMWIMFPPFVVSVLLITFCCLCVHNEPVQIKYTPIARHPWKMLVYLLLFTLSIVIVFRFVPYIYGLVIITAVLLIMDRKALKKVDYPLLCTFAAFFVFAGNMARIGFVRGIFEYLLGKSTLFFSVLSCQVISNVPSAILLSQFTDNYRELLIGVNIGGTGTLVASLASLITYSQYRQADPNGVRRYLLMFAGFNALFLGVLLAFSFIFQ